MDQLHTYIQILQDTTEIALATSVDNVPNVRIVSFIFDEKRPHVLYFAAHRPDAKVAEMRHNSNVAITTIPRAGDAHIRSRRVVAQKSALTIDELKDKFVARIEGYGEIIEAFDDALDVYELHIKEAVIVVVDVEKPENIVFTDIA